MGIRTRVGSLIALTAILAVAVPASAAPPDPLPTQTDAVTAPRVEYPAFALSAVASQYAILTLARTASAVARDSVVAHRMCDSVSRMDRRWRFTTHRTRPPTVSASFNLTSAFTSLDSTTERSRFRQRPSRSPSPVSDHDAAVLARYRCLTRT